MQDRTCDALADVRFKVAKSVLLEMDETEWNKQPWVKAAAQNEEKKRRAAASEGKRKGKRKAAYETVSH